VKILGRLRDASGSHIVCASGDRAIRKRVDLWLRLALHGANRAVEHAASREDMMSVQPLRKEGDQNPRTAEEAKALVKQVESLFMPWNIDALVAGFTDDCIVRFGTVPEFRGREVLRAFFTTRSGKQKGYRLKKSFRAMVNDTITNVWEGEWQDAETGAAMRGFGVEVWIMRDGKIAVWEGAFNTGRADQTNSVADLLR
jgi:nuclear transport factor 2 (NTF2) superfamily protein